MLIQFDGLFYLRPIREGSARFGPGNGHCMIYDALTMNETHDMEYGSVTMLSSWPKHADATAFRERLLQT